jgi:hypothetical protein
VGAWHNRAGTTRSTGGVPILCLGSDLSGWDSPLIFLGGYSPDRANTGGHERPPNARVVDAGCPSGKPSLDSKQHYTVRRHLGCEARIEHA